MNSEPTKPRSRGEIERTAAEWVLRRDRGLTAQEQDELSQWLAADPRHGEALALQRWGWDGGFVLLLAACALATACLALTWTAHDRGRGGVR
jgi:hypothetical protein